MKPRMRPHVQITRQHYRGKRWHVVKDPSSNQFYRLNPIAHEFVGLFDGKRTVEDIWKISLERHGDMAPTQHEAIQLLSQLYNSNLLAADANPETDQLLRRGRDRLKKKAIQQAIGIMYFKVKMFNPDAYLTWIEPLLRPLINVWGFAVWLVVVVAALVKLVPEWGELVDGAENVYSNPAMWPWLIVTFIVTKAIHETGHGVICKRYGGQVPEFGMMLLVLFPAPYVDASAAWGFENKWKRIAVGAGGMIFELFVAAIAAFVWLNTNPGSLTHQIAYNVMFTASISTVLFNANPLMRFDGYFILSDLLEVPNLMQRSQNVLKHLFKVYFYRLKNETPPSSDPVELVILFTYGVLAMIYRLFLFFSITMYVMGKLFAIGLMLAIWTAAMWFIMPVGKWVHWLATHHALGDHRFRAIATSILMVAACIGAVGLIPAPDHRRAAGVMEARAEAGVYFETSGFVVESAVRIGDWVEQGDTLVTMENARLKSELAGLEAQIAEYEVLEQRAVGRQEFAKAQIAQQSIQTRLARAAYLQSKLDKLIVRAPISGRVVSADPARIVGAYVQEGQAVCRLIDDRDLRVTALLEQQEAAWPNELSTDEYRVELRLISAADHVFVGRVDKLVEVGQRELPHPSFGYAGGGTIEIDTSEQSGLLAKDPQFVMHVSPLASEDGGTPWPGLPGERVRLRFTLPDRPYLSQWVDRLRKLVQGKVDI